MASFTFQFYNPQPKSKIGRFIGRVFGFVVAIAFFSLGLFVIRGAIRAIGKDDIYSGLFLLSFGLLFCGIGPAVIFLDAAPERRRKAAEAKQLAQTDGGKNLWLVRADWAAGKIKTEGAGILKWLLVAGIGIFFIGSIASFFMLKESLPKGDSAALFILIAPTVGFFFFIVATVALRAQHRFGDCVFELAQVPAPLGGSLDGVIQTSKPLGLENTLHLQLSCIRRTSSGGKNQHTYDETLWEDEKVFRHDANFPANKSGGTNIPVHFDLPDDEPESVPRGNPTVIWQLVAQSKMRGPNFFVPFEVPVFRVAGATHTPEKESDPTESLQASAEEIRREEHSKIQVTDGPNGREFYFPAARNLGRVSFMTLFAVGWGGVVWLLIAVHAFILFPIIFGAIEILLLCSAFSEWFRSDRVTVNSTEVTMQTRWLIFSSTRQFNANEVARFWVELRAETYRDIKLLWRESYDERKKRYQQTGQRIPFKFTLNDPDDVTVATYIRSKPETEWLVHEMNKALGRK